LAQFDSAALMFFRSVEAFPEGLIVDPDCVRAGGVQGFAVVSPSGRVAGSPALDQLPARLDARIFDHDWPYESIENNSDIEIRGNMRLIYLCLRRHLSSKLV